MIQKMNAAPLLKQLEHMIHFIEVESIPVAQKVTMNTIRELTAKGVDADGKRFHDYSPGYERRKNREGTVTRVTRERRSRTFSFGVERTTRSLKNLSDSGEMMNGIRAEDNKLVFGNARDEQIAHGQMYHPRWSYHHPFFLVGKTANNRIELALGKGVIK